MKVIRAIGEGGIGGNGWEVVDDENDEDNDSDTDTDPNAGPGPGAGAGAVSVSGTDNAGADSDAAVHFDEFADEADEMEGRMVALVLVVVLMLNPDLELELDFDFDFDFELDSSWVSLWVFASDLFGFGLTLGCFPLVCRASSFGFDFLSIPTSTLIFFIFFPLPW